jgi:hypothetical protein
LLWAPAVGADADDATERLHFEHPLVSESPSPDTKLRLDYAYAFAPWGSFEVDLPYTFVRPDGGPTVSHLDTVEVGVKLASFALAEQGLLLGGGLELGLPTGDGGKDIGSNHLLEIEPFLDVGWRWRRLQVVAFLAFGIPTNENDEDEADLELGWTVSLLYRPTSRLEALLEFDGGEVFGGEEDGHTLANVTPGLKWRVLQDRNLKIGAGVSLPITDEREFEVRPLFSIFYHF